MFKRTVPKAVAALFLLTLVRCGCCQSVDKDWSLGCYKQTTSNSCFNITAGDYYPRVNLTGKACVGACSALEINAKYAGLTANGVCLCSQLEKICLNQTANTSCSYLQNDGFYYKVFPVAKMPTMHAPKSVMTFNVFNVTIRSSDPNCTYTLDFDDGVRVTLSSDNHEIIKTHYYANVGEYKITLSSHLMCMPRTITATVDSNDTTFANASLDCPKAIEVTAQEELCLLEVVRGFGMNATQVSGKFIATLPDTVIETIGLPTPDVITSPTYNLLNATGTYVMPFLSAFNDGFLVGIEFHILSEVEVTVQILSPKCPAGKKPCRGGCVALSDPCPLQTRTENDMLSDSCSADVLTYSKSDSTYTVSEEIKVKFVNNSKPQYSQLPNPVAIKRGDIIAFHIPSASVVVFAKHDVSYILEYCDQSFGRGDQVTISSATMLNHTYLGFRVHVSTPVVLDIPIKPEIPNVSFAINVSTALDSTILEKTVEVQVRISGLEILEPYPYPYRYLVLEDIRFSFKVLNGTNICYTVHPGDGSKLEKTSTGSFINITLIHKYNNSGNYTFTVTASNDINSVNASQDIVVVLGIRNLKFITKPEDRPGEVGKEYNVSFFLEYGQRPIFQIDFGNNMSMFMACFDGQVNKTITANMTYTKVGTYNISVIAHGLVAKNSLRINSSVEIMQKIGNLTVYQKDAENKYIRIKNNTIEDHYPDKPIRLYANVSSGWPVKYRFVNESGKSEDEKIGSSHITFKNPTAGRWTIRIFAENAISNDSCTVIIKVVGKCESTIDMYDQRKRDDPFKTNLGSDIRINTHEREFSQNNCEKPLYSCWNYNWTLFNNGRIARTVEYTKHKKYFLIKKRVIKKPGLYRVEMVAKCNDSSRTITKSEHKSYFEVEASDPVANILGGEERDVRIGDEITLDASESYDPDVGLFNSSNLLFNWTCVNCSRVKFDKTNAAKVTIKSNLLKADESFEVMVKVTTNHEKVANATQIINVKSENYPTTLIKCRVNCLPLVNPTDRLSLEGSCTSKSGECNNNVTFNWTISKENGTNVEGLSTTTGFKKENLVLDPNVLKRSTKYMVKLVAEFNGLSSESHYPFKTAGMLTGGTCKPSPKDGIAAYTDFRIECWGWRGGKFPLTYKIQYQSVVGTNESEWILWYEGAEQVSPWNKLPAGQEENNYTIDIIVEIQGKYGEYVKKNYSVQVNQTDPKQFSKSLDSLDSIDGKEEPQKLTQQIIALSQELNNNPTTSEQNDEQIRQKFVEKLASGKADDLSLIQQTSKALTLATNDSEEVNHETQETAAKKLKEMAKTLLEIAAHSGTRTGEEIDETGTKLLNSFSKTLSASFFTGRETTEKDAPKEVKPNLYGTLSKRGNDLTKIGEKTEEVVKKFDDSIRDITAAIVERKLLGENPTVITTPKFEVKLRKGKPDRRDGKFYFKGTETNVEQTDVTPSIFLPIKALQFSKNETDSIYTEAITFDHNPYTWDIKNSHYIQPRVFSFKFRKLETGEEVKVKNLSEEINIQLPNDEKNIVYTPLNISADNENFLLFSFKVDESHYGEMIMIDIKSSKPVQKGAMLYVKYGAKVSPTNYDFKHQLSLQSRSCSDFPVDIKQNGNCSIIFIRDVRKVKSVEGVSVGLLPCPDTKNNLKPKCDLKDHQFSSFVQTVSCRYWNISEWQKDGCRVGDESTPLLSSCHCNHLTAFSSYIVKPNPLNKFSAEDFKRGYVSFVAVIVIFILYFISLIWARRADRSDVSKVGVCGLADNGPQDRYRYEIAIWTGMRRNAGTRSEVTIILSGEKNDSEPRCLVNPQNRNFARGSLEKFVLTSSKDIGSLYCIRVWHDNSHGSWYLSRVMVTDLQKDERYYFICDRWLAVDEDDGQVERLLPVASDEELADFHHLFYSKTKRGLSDTHLWVSVLNRPPQSIFTRVQRLSCCLCIIMTTMFVNAMFYETRSEPTVDNTNFIGSYSFTWDEVYIGVVSSLIIVPVNVIILHIFRNVRPKARKVRRPSKISMDIINPRYHNSSEASFQTLAKLSDQEPRASIAISTINEYSRPPSTELKKKRAEKLSRWARFKGFIMPSSLPHWFVYIGWIILVVVTLGSAAVVVLYGMQFGNGRSLQWLLSIFISIAEDIFVLQPLKVLVFALAFALLVKKPDEGEFESSGDLNDDEVEQMDILESQNSIPEKKRTPSSPRLPVRPTEEQLAGMRKARLKERKMLFLIQEITVHLIFTIVIALVTYGHKDHRSVYLYRHIAELGETRHKLTNFPQFWNWSRDVLVPKAFPEKLYNGDDVPSFGFLDDGYNNLISRARMRLLRVKNDSCEVAKEFKNEINACLKDYSIFGQDEGCYYSRWNSIKKGKRKSHWCFQNWKDLDGYPTWGTFTTYSGSGFIKELRPGDDNNETMNKLESHRWLNRQARALLVEMTTYNANINLYTSITLLFEFPEFGGIFYFRNINPMRLKLYVGGFAFFILACEVVFVLFIFGYFYIALKKFYRQRMAYFKEFWNVLDFAILMTSFAAIGVYAYRIDLTTKLMQRVPDRNGEFVNFQYVTYWNEVLNCLIALVVALTTVKLTKLMRFNLRISLFGKTLQDAKHALAGFSVQFGIVFFAYVMIGVLVFGYNVSQFRSIISAMMALGRVILGKSQFSELFTADPVIGPLYFLTYVMFVCWILVTMFVAILNDSYHDVQDRCFGMSNEYEVVDFILARLRAWSGLGGKKNLIPADRRWRQAGIKVRAAAALGRQRCYKPSDENIALEKTGDLMEKFEDSVRSLENRVDHLSEHFE